MLNTQKTGHDVSGWTSKISQDFLILIFRSLLSVSRTQVVPFLHSVDIVQMQVTWEVSTPHYDEWMRVTCWLAILSSSPAWTTEKYVGWEVQSHVLNEERIEREVSFQWLGIPWCCTVGICVHMQDVFFLLSCAGTAYFQSISVYWGEHSALSHFPLSWRDTRQFLKGLWRKWKRQM